MSDAPVIYSLALYCLAVLLPIVPAAVIFRMFPDTRVSVSGPLQNLSLRTTGAFAAYVVTAVLGFVLIQNVIRQIDMMASSTWILAVPIQLVDTNRKLLAQRAAVDFVNFKPDLYRPGETLVYVTLPHRVGSDWPTLHFGVQGFESGVLDVQQIVDDKGAKIAEIDAAARRIVVKRPVTLTELGKAFTSVEYSSLPPLEPLEATAGGK